MQTKLNYTQRLSKSVTLRYLRKLPTFSLIPIIEKTDIKLKQKTPLVKWKILLL